MARLYWTPLLVACAALFVCAAHAAAQDAKMPQAAGSLTSATRPSRQLLQRVFAFDCVGKKCGAEVGACSADSDCAMWLACAGKCTPLLTPKNIALHYPCQVKCMYQHNILHNRAANNLNTCVLKNNCSTVLTLGPKFCLSPKGGPSKTVKFEDLKGRYNVLAGANHLVNCQPSQFRFNYPKPKQFVYQERPSYLKNGTTNSTGTPKPYTTVTTKPYLILSHEDGFTTALGYLAGLKYNSTYVVLDATKNNDFVLVMYCTKTDVIHAGYVLAKAGRSAIPAAVFKRFAAKLKASIWADYYDLPLSSFCKVKPVTFA